MGRLTEQEIIDGFFRWVQYPLWGILVAFLLMLVVSLF